MCNALLSLLLISISPISFAGEADVLSAKVENVGDDFYRFHVTVKHADESWEHFAKVWKVLGLDGVILGSRILRHPHINEQPFTRTLTISIPKEINIVTIRAYDLIHKFGGQEFTLELNKENQDDTK